MLTEASSYDDSSGNSLFRKLALIHVDEDGNDRGNG